MAGNAISIAILGNAQPAVSAFGDAGGAARSMKGDVDNASTSIKSMEDRMGDGASKSSQFAGGIGDLGGALAQIPGPLGALGTGMEALGPTLMGAVGAFDLMELATKSNIVQTARQTVVTGAQKVATVASTAVTKAAAAGQWLLNAAMMANPIGLVVIAIVALVAIFVVAYKKSETFRNIVNASWSAIKTGAQAVFGFLTGYIGGVFNGIMGLWTKIRDFKDRVVGVFTGLFDRMKNIGSDVINGIISGLDNAWQGLKDKISSLASLIPDGVKSLLGISSPSRVMMLLGEQTIAGFAQGFASTNAKDIVDPLARGMASASIGAPSMSGGSAGVGSGIVIQTLNVTASPLSSAEDTARAVVGAIRKLEQGIQRPILQPVTAVGF